MVKLSFAFLDLTSPPRIFGGLTRIAKFMMQLTRPRALNFLLIFVVLITASYWSLISRYVLTTNEHPILEKVEERPKAAIITLVRNRDLEGMKRTLRTLEERFNNKYKYPYIFLVHHRWAIRFHILSDDP